MAVDLARRARPGSREQFFHSRRQHFRRGFILLEFRHRFAVQQDIDQGDEARLS